MFAVKNSRAALSLICAAALAACAHGPTDEELAYRESIANESLLPATEEEREAIRSQDPITQATFWGMEFERSPGDMEAAVEFVGALRAIGSEQRAQEVASQALAMAPNNAELLSHLGKSLLTSGDANGSVNILRRAMVAAPDDLSIPVALGVAYDQTGRHREAQNTYRRVLERDPNSAAALSNLGLSLALTGNPEEAEIYLRRAVVQPEAGARERQNLALVLSIQGKFDEARDVGAADLPDELVDANIDYFRAMLTPRQRNYSTLRGTTDE